MHHTRPVMWFVLLTCVHLALAVDPGCSQEHPYRLLKDETSNEFACFNIAWTKAFDGYCGGEEADREIRMFHGNGDNPNDIVETCAKACVEQKSPVAMEGEKNHTWNDAFVLRGIVVKPNGRCYCQMASSESCDRVTGNSYDRYDIVRESMCACTCEGCTPLIIPSIATKDLNWPSNSLELCEGECDTDEQCMGDLKCFQRSSSRLLVPGCDTSNITWWPEYDFCYNDTSLLFTTTNPHALCSKETATQPCSTTISPSDRFTETDNANAPTGNEYRTVAYAGTSCYFTNGHALTIGDTTCNEGQICAFDVQLMSRNNYNLRPTLHAMIMDGTIIKGAEGSTPQTDGDNTVCRITGNSAPLNDASRAVMLNEVKQYLSGDTTNLPVVRKFDSADNAEIGEFGAIGPGTWQANFVHSVDLHDFEISSEKVMQKSFVQGCFDLRIETVTAVDEHSRLVLKGTDADAPFTVETPRFDLVDWVSRTTPFSHRHRDEYGRTMVGGGCVLAVYEDEKRNFKYNNHFEGKYRFFGPGHYHSGNTGGSDWWIHEISSVALFGHNCRATFRHQGFTEEDARAHWRSGDNAYPYRNLRTKDNDFVAVDLMDTNDDSDIDNRVWNHWEDEIDEIFVWYEDKDRCEGRWEWMGMATGMGPQNGVCKGQIRYGLPDHYVNGGFKDGNGWQYRNTKISTCQRVQEIEDFGYTSYDHIPYGMSVGLPYLEGIVCECCRNTNLDTPSAHGLPIPASATSNVGTTTVNVCKYDDGGLELEYVGGVGIAKLGFPKWQGHIYGPDGTDIGGGLIQLGNTEPDDENAGTIDRLIHMQRPQQEIESESNFHVRWKCSPGKTFVCNDRYDMPISDNSCCQNCPPGKFKSDGLLNCKACSAGKFNPLGGFEISEASTLHFGQQSAELRVKTTAGDAFSRNTTCNTSICKCQSYLPDMVCQQTPNNLLTSLESREAGFKVGNMVKLVDKVFPMRFMDDRFSVYLANGPLKTLSDFGVITKLENLDPPVRIRVAYSSRQYVASDYRMSFLRVHVQFNGATYAYLDDAVEPIDATTTIQQSTPLTVGDDMTARDVEFQTRMKLACLAQPGCHAFEVRQKDNQIVNSFPPANPLAPVGPRLYHVAAETSFTGERLQNPCIKEVATQCKNDTDAFLARWDQYVCYDTPGWSGEGCPHDPYVYSSMYFTLIIDCGGCQPNSALPDLPPEQPTHRLVQRWKDTHVREYTGYLIDSKQCDVVPYTPDMFPNDGESHAAAVYRFAAPTTSQLNLEATVDTGQHVYEIGMKCSAGFMNSTHTTNERSCEYECLKPTFSHRFQFNGRCENRYPYDTVKGPFANLVDDQAPETELIDACHKHCLELSASTNLFENDPNIENDHNVLRGFSVSSSLQWCYCESGFSQTCIKAEIMNRMPVDKREPSVCTCPSGRTPCPPEDPNKCCDNANSQCHRFLKMCVGFGLFNLQPINSHACVPSPTPARILSQDITDFKRFDYEPLPCYAVTFNKVTNECQLFSNECLMHARTSASLNMVTFAARRQLSDVTHQGDQVTVTPAGTISQNYKLHMAKDEQIEFNIPCVLDSALQSSCLDCPSGRYSDEPGLSRCKYCTSDNYQPLAGQTSCLSCDPGSFSYRQVDIFNAPIDQQPFCLAPVFLCDSLTSKRVNNVCVDKRICPLGQVYNNAVNSCEECPVGRFAAADSTCASITDDCMCDPDLCAQSVEKRGFSFRGKYNPNTLRCDPDCESLLAFYDYDLQSCQCKGGLALTDNRPCQECPRGTYTFESRCIVCDAGQFQPVPGKDSCIQCPNGKFTDNSGSVKCKLCKSNQESTSKREGCRTCDSADQSQNRKYRPCFECEPCSELCPEHTFASHDELTQMPMCTDKCDEGARYNNDASKSCVACPTGKYKQSISPLPPAFSHNTSYACHFCPVGKFQNAAGRQDCTDGIPFSTVSGANEPTTIQGLTEVVQACKSSVEQATCKVCGIDRTDQITTISNGVWVAYEGQKLMSQQNYFRFGNINDGYSEWKYIGNSTRETQPECSYQTFAGYNVPPITSEPHCQMLPNTDYLEDTQTCGDVGQNKAAAINLYSTQVCRRCEWPFEPDDACGCTAPQEPYYFPGFKHDERESTVSGLGPFLHGGGPDKCPDYSNFANKAFLFVDGVSLINLPAVSLPMTDCPPAQSDIMCVNGAVACEPECKCQCFPGFSGDTCDTCTDSNADIAVGCEACKQGWVKGVYGQCTRCESGLDIRTGCTSCIPFLDADMCYGVNDACIPDIQRPEVSFITTHHTWTTDALEFASMPHALPHQVPAYLDNVCVAHGGMVYTFDRAASQVTIQPGQGNANVARTAISKWPWTLNVAFKSENVFCDDVQVTNYLNSHTYATTNVPDDLQWTCIEDAKGRYWVITTYEKMQVSSCTSSTTYADDVLRVLPTAGAFTPLTARLHDAVSADLTWAVTNKTTYYDCATDSNPWLFVLTSSQCLHYDPGGSKVNVNVPAVSGGFMQTGTNKQWRHPVSMMPDDSSIVVTYNESVSRLHCVQMCQGQAFWLYTKNKCMCLDHAFLDHDTTVPVGYMMTYNSDPDDATFAMAVGNKPYACARNATHAPYNGYCVKDAPMYTEWGGVTESTPLLRKQHVTSIVTHHEDSILDFRPLEQSTCSRGPFELTQVPVESASWPLGQHKANLEPLTSTRNTQLLFSETPERSQGLFQIHVEPDFEECNEVAEAASVVANLQSQQTAGSTFCTEGTCDHTFVDMTQNIARAQNAYQLALSKCQLSIDLMGDTNFYVLVTQCAENETPTADGCVVVSTNVTLAPTPAPTVPRVSSLVNPVDEDTVFFGTCNCGVGGSCNCTCDCNGQFSSITATQLPFNHTNGTVDCNEFCKIAPLDDISTDFCVYGRERRLYHMHFMPEWTLTRPTATTSIEDAMVWCQSNIACSLFSYDQGTYKYYADPEYTLNNCDEPRQNTLFTQAADFSLTVITYYKTSCCTGVVI